MKESKLFNSTDTILLETIYGKMDCMAFKSLKFIAVLSFSGFRITDKKVKAYPTYWTVLASNSYE